MLRELQQQLKELWTGETYTKEFQESPTTHKDFQHALLHVAKASGKLAALVEDLDHVRREGLPLEEVRKYLADLIICSLRMGNTTPGGEIDLEKAVIERIESKMGPVR